MSSYLFGMKLLMEGFSSAFRPIGKATVVESEETGFKIYRRKGVFQNCSDTNINRRVYPESIWKTHFTEGHAFADRLGRRNVLGMLEHPEDGVTRIGLVSHIVTECRFATKEEVAESKGTDYELKESDIIGVLEALDTPEGRTLKALMDAKVEFGVSSRGSGSLTEDGDKYIVENDYELETFDVVFAPSVARAIPRMIETAAKEDDNLLREDAERIKRERIKELEEEVEQLKNKKFDDKVVVEKKEKPKPIIESANMNKQAEMNKQKAKVIRFVQTETKSLSPSEKAVLFQEADELSRDIEELVLEDKALKPVAKGLQKRISSYLKEMDEYEAEPAPDMGGEELGDEGLGDEECDEAAKDVLMRASDKLRSMDDPEAESLAAEVDDLCLSNGGYDDEMEAIPEPEEMPMESRKAFRKLQRQTALVFEAHNRLKATSAEMLESYRKLKVNLRESDVTKITEERDQFEAAAHKIASRYNESSIALGTHILKTEKPEIYEANKEKLGKITKWKQFVETFSSIFEEAKAPKEEEEGADGGKADDKAKKASGGKPWESKEEKKAYKKAIKEAKKAEKGKQSLEESKTSDSDDEKKKISEAEEDKKSKKADKLSESTKLHPMLQATNRSRSRINKVNG